MCRVALVALLVLAAWGGDAGAGSRHFHVLFIGNSLTATNDLPGMVTAIARGVGHATVDTRTVAPGGFALEDHWTMGAARDALDGGRWDVVVLQQGPSSLPESRANLIEWAKRWADAARAHGARPALLTVWPETARSSVFGDVVRNYHDAAVQAETASFPAGAAWRDALRRTPKPLLYGPDGFHPSRLGTYLAALVVYQGLTGELPRTLPGVVPFSPATARVLHAAASSAYSPPRRATGGTTSAR